jgi:membrane associated rhomboid family serine protease
MTTPRRPTTGADAAIAGTLLLAVIVLCGGALYGIGSLFGAGVALGIVGLIAGFPLGFLVVRDRFRDV